MSSEGQKVFKSQKRKTDMLLGPLGYEFDSHRPDKVNFSNLHTSLHI